MLAHPELQGLRSWMQITRDVHALHQRMGFTRLAAPDRWMGKWAPDVYGAGTP